MQESEIETESAAPEAAGNVKIVSTSTGSPSNGNAETKSHDAAAALGQPARAAERGFSRSLRSSGKASIDVREAVLEFPSGPLGRRSIKNGLFRMLGLGRPEFNNRGCTVRALDGVSFSVCQGERVGIIGPNGAGKSSSLRALAGVFPLSGGSIEISGHVSTLLNVTQGFQPEATGRENIYHRGMAMGLDPRALRAYEDQIVAFADLGHFIDLPVRAYSSGMYVRLGFAISTQFIPDILLLDEFFGAGDAQFAKKAFARMHEIVNQAGILVMVTHNAGLAKQICDRIIWLSEGKIIMDGPAVETVDAYLEAVLYAERTAAEKT